MKKKIELRYKAIILIFFILSILPIKLAYSKNITFVKEYIYNASDFDSKISSRTIALEQTKRLLLEELGAYISSQTEIKDMKLTKDKISTFTAGIIGTEIVEEKWDGKQYYLKARLSVDKNKYLKSLKKIINNKNEIEKIEDARNDASILSSKISKLNKELSKTQPNQKEIKKYNDTIKKLSATDWYEKGLAFGRTGNLKKALESHDKAIELNPNYMQAYSMRALIYVKLGNSKKATLNFIKAAKLGDKRAQKLLNMKKIHWK